MQFTTTKRIYWWMHLGDVPMCHEPDRQRQPTVLPGLEEACLLCALSSEGGRRRLARICQQHATSSRHLSASTQTRRMPVSL